jgi:hypothetical protein
MILGLFDRKASRACKLMLGYQTGLRVVLRLTRPTGALRCRLPSLPQAMPKNCGQPPSESVEDHAERFQRSAIWLRSTRLDDLLPVCGEQ